MNESIFDKEKIRYLFALGRIKETISNMHKLEMTEIANRRDNLVQKPNIKAVLLFGIEKNKQVAKKIGLHIFEIYIYNSYLIVCQKTESN